MNETVFTVRGFVVHAHNRRGVPDLRVEAWDKDLLFDDFLGAATTDRQGKFVIEFKAAYFREWIFDPWPDVYFKVYSGQKLIASTEDSVLWNLKSKEHEVTIEVSLPADFAGDVLFYAQARRLIAVRKSRETGGIVAEVPAGTLLAVIEIIDDWLRVRTPGAELGFVHARDLPVFDEAIADFELPAPTSVFNPQAVELLYRVLKQAPGISDEQRVTLQKAVECLVEWSEKPLHYLLVDGMAYLRGDPVAEHNFRSALSYFIIAADPPPRPRNVVPISGGPGAPGSAGPGSFIPAEGFPPIAAGCFIPPQWIGRLNLAAVRAAIGSRDLTDSAVQDAAWRTLWTIDTLVHRAAPLEFLHAAAVSVAQSNFSDYARFENAAGIVLHSGCLDGSLAGGFHSGQIPETQSGLQPMMGFVPPRFGVLQPPFGLDLCRLERGAETDRLIQACWCRERYAIETIVNDDAEDASAERRACAGQMIEIRGSGFGEVRRYDDEIGDFGPPTGERPAWGSTARRNHVVFRGRDRAIPVHNDPDYDGWFDDRIRVRVPPGAVTGDITLVVVCRGHTVLGRHPCLTRKEDDNRPGARRLTVVEPAIVRDISVTPDPIRACEPFILTWRTEDAEHVHISGPGIDETVGNAGELDMGSRTINLNPTPEDRLRYRVEAWNLCRGADEGPASRSASFEVDYPMEFGEDAVEIPRDSADRPVPLRLPCPAPVDGVAVHLTSSSSGVVSVLDTIHFAGGASEGSVLLTSGRPGSALINASAASGTRPPYRAPAPLRVFVTPFIERIDPTTEYINRDIHIYGHGFVSGATRIRFAGRTSEGYVETEALVIDSRTAAAVVPEKAITGTVQAVVSGRESNEGPRLTIRDPEISRVNPALPLHGAMITVDGRGFSTTASLNEGAFDGASGPALPESSTPTSLLRMRVPGDASFATRIRVTVRPPDGEGDARTSAPFSLTIARRAGAFREASLGAATRTCNDGGTPVRVEVGSPRVNMVGTVEVQEFPYTLHRGADPGAEVLQSGAFRIGGGIGGVALSSCCSYLVVLSYLGGAFEFAQPSRFNMVIFSTRRGGPEVHRSELHSARSGEMGSFEPRVYFSPDCSIVLYRGFANTANSAYRIWDLAQNCQLDHGFVLNPRGITAHITDDNRIRLEFSAIPGTGATTHHVSIRRC